MFINNKEFLSENDLNILLFHGDLDEITSYFSDDNNNEYKLLIDAIVLGHEHNNYIGYIQRVGKPSIPYAEVALDSTGNFGLGIIDLKYNNTKRKLELATVNSTYGKEESSELTNLSKIVTNIVTPFFKETIGVVQDYALDGTKSVIRNNESNMGDFVVDSFLDVAKKRLLVNKIPQENIFGIVNSGAIRNDSIIPVGYNFTTETVYTVLPFVNEIVFLKITGKQNLLSLIDYLGNTSFTKKNSGGWLQITKNLKFDYINKKFELLDYNTSIEEYYLVLNDFLAEGNDGYSELKNNVNYSSDKLSSDIPSQNALIEYVKKTLNGIISISNIYNRIIV
jgi:2',3'-cyclic-nucleotide 2'-phosphodiesterase (5'-nucleotidase family)